MKLRELGNTGLMVSPICFGSLTIGPLQRNLTIMEGSRVINRAIELGINFIDTADLYRTYPFIREALEIKPDLIVSTKSYAYDTKTARDTLERALKGTGRDYIDIFMLHEQESPLTLKGHEEALRFFIRQKEKGVIRAVGISTHHVAAVRAAAKMNEIDVIHPILNFRGLGVVDGTRQQMEQAIHQAWQAGKGIYIMKCLGGGHLLQYYEEAMNYIISFPYAHSIALGMQRVEEVDANVEYFIKGAVSKALRNQIKQYKRELIIEDNCLSCGSCIKRCPQQALYIHDNRVQVDREKCVLCGYCGTECKELAIKII
jgi:predicted aldo/keto reductase-like oxidoreductase